MHRASRSLRPVGGGPLQRHRCGPISGRVAHGDDEGLATAFAIANQGLYGSTLAWRKLGEVGCHRRTAFVAGRRARLGIFSIIAAPGRRVSSLPPVLAQAFQYTIRSTTATIPIATTNTLPITTKWVGSADLLCVLALKAEPIAAPIATPRAMPKPTLSSNAPRATPTLMPMAIQTPNC